MNPRPAAWWEQRWAVAALMLLSAIPLLKPDIPPLVDLPGHMARYRVQMEIGQDAALRHFYRFDWSLIGNLGVDLLIVPLSKVFGVELAVKLIVLAIPPMTAGGFLWVAREVHGRVPPTALFAVPLAYNFPFQFGFVNFALSMAFAFLAFAFWLRLARLGRLKLRTALFVPISCLIWLTHTFGWGTLGVMAFSAELVRQHDLKRPAPLAFFRAGLHASCMALPMLLMIVWRNADHVTGLTGDWFNWQAKFLWIEMALRDRWRWLDIGALIVLGIVLITAALRVGRMEFSRNLGMSALFLLLVYVLLPRIVFGSAYADMRLVPYMIALAVIAVRFHHGDTPWWGRTLAMAGLLFCLVRLGGTTISYWRYDQDYDQELAALTHVPLHARLATFIGHRCRPPWAMSRLEHLSGLATVRRRAFSNDQWSMPGGQLLTVHYTEAGRFAIDPSQLAMPRPCRGEVWRPLAWSLAKLPRNAFDYVWLVRPPAYDPALARGLAPVWRSGASVLYQVEDRTPPGPPQETR